MRQRGEFGCDEMRRDPGEHAIHIMLSKGRGALQGIQRESCRAENQERAGQRKGLGSDIRWSPKCACMTNDQVKVTSGLGEGQSVWNGRSITQTRVGGRMSGK